MNYTTNFNLIKPEGTDNYNHLTIDNPNMDTIDSVMQSNKLASVGAATELVSGTVHAITRSDSNQNIFRFKATGNFTAGDTISVDGVSVNAFTLNGKPLPNNAYVLSSEVLCVLDGTSLWVQLYDVTDELDAIRSDINDIDNILDINDININNYFSAASGFSILNAYMKQVSKSLAYILIEIRPTGTIGAGENTFGSCTNAVKLPTLLAGRCSTSGNSYPATAILLPGGAARLHTDRNCDSFLVSGFVTI